MSFILAAFGFLRNSWIGRALAVAGGVLVAVLLIFSAGKRAQRREAKTARLEEYIDVRKRADKAADQVVRDLDGISDDELVVRLRDKFGAVRD